MIEGRHEKILTVKRGGCRATSPPQRSIITEPRVEQRGEEAGRGDALGEGG